MPPGAEGADGQHLLDRMGVRVLQHGVGAELLTRLAEERARALVESQRHFHLFEGGPERLVVRIVPVPPVDLVGPEKDPAESQLSHAAARLHHGVVHVEGGNHARPDQTLGIFLAELVEPVVVRAGHGRGKGRIHVRNGQSE